MRDLQILDFFSSADFNIVEQLTPSLTVKTIESQPVFTRLSQGTDALFNLSCIAANNFHLHFLQLMPSKTHKPSKKLWYQVKPDVLVRYCLIWKRLLIFVLQVFTFNNQDRDNSSDTESLTWVLPSNGMHLDTPAQMKSSVRLLNAQLNNPDVDSKSVEMIESILAVSISLFAYQGLSKPYKYLIVAFLLHQAWLPHTKSYQMPKDYRATLSGLIWSARLLYAYSFHLKHTASLDPVTCFETYKKLRALYLIAGCYGPMTAVFHHQEFTVSAVKSAPPAIDV